MKHLSIIMVVKNGMPYLPRCFQEIFSQDIAGIEIEIIVMDGGSSDGSCQYAREMGAKVFDAGYAENQEARRYLGILEAKGDIFAFIDVDNFMPNRHWLKQMLDPFNKSEVMCSFTSWYQYSESLTKFDNYYALIGGNDPIAYYLGKNDRMEYRSDRLPRGAILVERSEFVDYVRFDINKLPTIGCNGFFARKSYYDLVELNDPDEFMHTDIHVDLLKIQPQSIYAIVKTGVIHATGKTLYDNLKKRLKYKSIHNDRLSHYRRYYVFNIGSKRDTIILLLTICCSITLIEPIWRSILGYVKTGKKEWFLHPIALIAMVFAYGYSEAVGWLHTILRSGMLKACKK